MRLILAGVLEQLGHRGALLYKRLLSLQGLDPPQRAGPAVQGRGLGKFDGVSGRIIGNGVVKCDIATADSQLALQRAPLALFASCSSSNISLPFSVPSVAHRKSKVCLTRVLPGNARDGWTAAWLTRASAAALHGEGIDGSMGQRVAPRLQLRGRPSGLQHFSHLSLWPVKGALPRNVIAAAGPRLPPQRTAGLPPGLPRRAAAPQIGPPPGAGLPPMRRTAPAAAVRVAMAGRCSWGPPWGTQLPGPGLQARRTCELDKPCPANGPTCNPHVTPHHAHTHLLYQGILQPQLLCIHPAARQARAGALATGVTCSLIQAVRPVLPTNAGRQAARPRRRRACVLPACTLACMHLCMHACRRGPWWSAMTRWALLRIHTHTLAHPPDVLQSPQARVH